MAKNPYKNFWRTRKKYINLVIAIGIILFAIFLEVMINRAPLSENELIQVKDNYCENNCASSCQARESTVSSYEMQDTRCQCECSDNTRLIFGLEEFNKIE